MGLYTHGWSVHHAAMCICEAGNYRYHYGWTLCSIVTCTLIGSIVREFVASPGCLAAWLALGRSQVWMVLRRRPVRLDKEKPDRGTATHALPVKPSPPSTTKLCEPTTSSNMYWLSVCPARPTRNSDGRSYDLLRMCEIAPSTRCCLPCVSKSPNAMGDPSGLVSAVLSIQRHCILPFCRGRA